MNKTRLERELLESLGSFKETELKRMRHPVGRRMIERMRTKVLHEHRRLPAALVPLVSKASRGLIQKVQYRPWAEDSNRSEFVEAKAAVVLSQLLHELRFRTVENIG